MMAYQKAQQQRLWIVLSPAIALGSSNDKQIDSAENLLINFLI